MRRVTKSHCHQTKLCPPDCTLPHTMSQGRQGRTHSTSHCTTNPRRLDFPTYLRLASFSRRCLIGIAVSSKEGTVLSSRRPSTPYQHQRTSSMNRPDTQHPRHRSDTRYAAWRMSTPMANCLTFRRRGLPRNQHGCDRDHRSRVPCTFPPRTLHYGTGKLTSNCARCSNSD